MALTQVEYQFKVPGFNGGAHIGAAFGRKLVGSVAGNALHPRIFHHTDDRRGTLNGPSLVRWGGGRKMIRLIGLGPLGIDDVDRAVWTIHAALSERFGPVSVGRRDSRCCLRFAEKPSAFIASNMVVASKPRDFEVLILDADEASRREIVLKALVSGLRKQYKGLHDAYGETFGDEMGDLDWRMLDIKLLGVGPLRMVRGGSYGDRVFHYTTCDVAFSASMDLSGQWNGGLVTSAGFGNTWYAQLPRQCPSWGDYLEHFRGRADDMTMLAQVAMRSRQRRARPGSRSSAEDIAS